MILMAVSAFAAELPPLTEPPPPPPPPPLPASESVAPPPLPRPSDAPFLEPLPGRRGGRYAYEGGDVPAGFHLVTRPRTGMLVAGAVVFGVSYLITLYVGLLLGDGWAVLPLAGPIIVGVNVATPSSVGVVAFLSGLLTLTQGLGVTLFTLSLTNPYRWLERNGGLQLSVVPTPGGAAVLGRF